MDYLNKPTVRQLTYLVGNPDVYAVQFLDKERKGAWRPVREPLDRAVLRAHLKGEVTVGTYIVNPPDQARTLVFDIDAPDEEEQRVQLKAVTRTLIDINRSNTSRVPLFWTTEWTGRKGWHVWLQVEGWVPAELLYRLGRGVREEAGLPNLEVFPKQTRVRDLGNLVKLPGGLHLVSGEYSGVLGEVGKSNPVDLIEEVAALYPEVALRTRSDAPATVEYPCVHSIQGGVKEGGRNIHLFHLAVMLRRWSLTDENVETIVRRANEASDDGPLEEAELVNLLDSSRHSGPICGQLSDEVHCGEQCILTKHKGLHTRTGSLKWAAEGEKVVVQVRERSDDGRVVELEHDDLVQGRVILREPGRKGE